MNKRTLKVLKVLGGIALGLLLVVGMMGSVAAIPAPAPLAARVIVINSGGIAADTSFRAIDWSSYSEADVFYRIDQTSATSEGNYIDLLLQVSPDGTNWYGHIVSYTLVANVTTDTNHLVVRIPVEGAQFRINADLKTNTTTVTPNLKVVLR